MKTTALATTLILAVSSASAQTAPLKGVNTIVLALPDSGVVAWKRIAQVLTSQGYAIKQSDKELLTLGTEQKYVKVAGNTSFSVVIQGHTATLRGTQQVTAINNDLQPITYRGMKGSPFMVAWDELQKMAAAIGGPVSYKKQ